jgi:hypothetical protein
LEERSYAFFPFESKWWSFLFFHGKNVGPLVRSHHRTHKKKKKNFFFFFWRKIHRKVLFPMYLS